MGLYFASAEDVLQRYFLIANGSERIAHDMSHFIERGLARMYTKEYTLKQARFWNNFRAEIECN